MTDLIPILALILTAIAALAAVGTFLQSRVVLALVAVALTKRFARKRRLERQRQAERIRMFAQDSASNPENVVHRRPPLNPANRFSPPKCGTVPYSPTLAAYMGNLEGEELLKVAVKRHEANARKETWKGANPCSVCLYLIAAEVERGNFGLGGIQL